MKPIVTWVLVADGAAAKVFEHDGPGKGLTAVKGLSFEEDPAQARELMSDRQGRSFASAGHGRSALAWSTDPVEVRESRFVKRVVEALDKKLLEGKFERLLVIAAPAALGDIRGYMTDRLKKVTMAELDKDLTNLSTPELEKHLEDHLPV